MSNFVYSEQPREDYSIYPDMSAGEIDAFIRAQEWRTAKTMPDKPHRYISKSKCTDPETFERLVAHIRKHGYRAKYGKAYYTYFDWTEDGVTSVLFSMGWPVRGTFILNRAPKPEAITS
jgi:hypothetical protein